MSAPSYPSDLTRLPEPQARRKVRTGCVTCKNRKIKCDEGKPFCMRCVNSRRRCYGYLTPAPLRSSPNAVTLSLSHLPGLEVAEEFRAFDYYQSCLAPVLGGTVDRAFWGGLVLRFCLAEPAVRHTVLALGSLHESIGTGTRPSQDGDKTFALVEYGKAMAIMRQWKPDEPAGIPLLVCVLFTCIEFLLGHEMSSQLHILQGRHILSTLADAQSPAMDMIKQELIPVYTRLGLASFLFTRRPAAIPLHLISPASVPSAGFKSLYESRNYLYYLLDGALRFSANAKLTLYAPEISPGELEGLEATRQDLLLKLDQWYAAFVVLGTETQLDRTWSEKEARSATQKLLEIYHHAAVVWVSTALERSELAYDSYTSSFASIISLASSIIGYQESGSGSHPLLFSFETGVIAPIYWTVIKCRHPMLRRSALTLLKRDKMRERKENLWYGREAIAIASRVIELEENPELQADTFALDHDQQEIFNSSPESLQQQESFDSKLWIPLSQPPTIQPAPLDLPELPIHSKEFIFSDAEDLDTTPRRTLSPCTTSPSESHSTLSTQGSTDALALSPPFNIHEPWRIKNAIRGPRRDGGVWTAMITEPAAGQQRWRITRELLKL